MRVVKGASLRRAFVGGMGGRAVGRGCVSVCVRVCVRLYACVHLYVAVCVCSMPLCLGVGVIA
jgi:hypothetical protein